MKDLGREGSHAYARLFTTPVWKSAEIISSAATPKGRMLTMRRWPFEPGQCILTLAGNDDRGFGHLCGTLAPAT